jgi:hypothetical protein
MTPTERDNMTAFIGQVYGYSKTYLKNKTDEEIQFIYQRACIKHDWGKA